MSQPGLTFLLKYPPDEKPLCYVTPQLSGTMLVTWEVEPLWREPILLAFQLFCKPCIRGLISVHLVACSTGCYTGHTVVYLQSLGKQWTLLITQCGTTTRPAAGYTVTARKKYRFAITDISKKLLIHTNSLTHSLYLHSKTSGVMYTDHVYCGLTVAANHNRVHFRCGRTALKTGPEESCWDAEWSFTANLSWQVCQ